MRTELLLNGTTSSGWKHASQNAFLFSYSSTNERWLERPTSTCDLDVLLFVPWGGYRCKQKMASQTVKDAANLKGFKLD